MKTYRCMYETFHDVVASSEEEAETLFREHLAAEAANLKEPLGCICWEETDD